MTVFAGLTWLNDYDNITGFGAVLAQSGMSAADLQYYYEKPWKWENEYARWESAGKPDEFNLTQDDGTEDGD